MVGKRKNDKSSTDVIKGQRLPKDYFLDNEIPAEADGEVSEADLDATQLYLNSIGFTPLLTQEEEKGRRTAPCTGQSQCLTCFWGNCLVVSARVGIFNLD